MKKSFYILIILFICGIISADVCIGMLVKERNTLFDLDVYISFANAKFAFKDVFWNIVYERAKLFAMVLILCFTPIRERMVAFFLALFCFIWGFYMMNLISVLGGAGIVVGIAVVLPHGILYGILFFLMVWGREGHRYRRNEKVMMNIGTYIFLLLLFVTGCVVETLMGTHFVPWLIRLSII